MKNLWSIAFVIAAMAISDSGYALGDAKLDECVKVRQAGSRQIEGVTAWAKQLKTEVAAAGDAKFKFDTTCREWQSHKQDSYAIGQLTSARNELAKAVHDARTTLDRLSNRVRITFPHVSGLGFDGCETELNELNTNFMPSAQTELNTDGNFQCQ